MAGRVLVVDDDVVFARALVRALEGHGFSVRWLTHGARLTASLAEGEVDAAVVEAVMPGLSGLKVLEQLAVSSPRTRVLVVAASPQLDTAVEAMKKGAVDYLVKPLSPEAVAQAVRALVPVRPVVPAGEEAESRPESGAGMDLIGRSTALREVQALIQRVAATDAPVLIAGESGTGKELVARAIHRLSRRHDRLFLAVNCGALAEGTLDSELFGHVRGAFTGARTGRRGLFEEADRGTLFLDEIGSTPLSFQVKLLRVLEEGELRPVGGSASLRINTRVIAASNVDLRAAVRAGRFRDDLYYRLNVVSIALPPLRERGEDLQMLVEHFLAASARQLGRPVSVQTPGFAEALRRHSWPGNVRELRNAIERAVLLADGRRLEAGLLPDDVKRGHGDPAADSALLPYGEAKREALGRFTRDYLRRLLLESSGNVSRAALVARVPRQTLHRLLRSLRGETVSQR